MEKIMLVLDNNADQGFLEKVLKRLGYKVISMKKGGNLSEHLIDHFPDLVFASTLGRNEKILNALGKIKEARGKPKLVFVKQEKEGGNLSENQKKIIDGVIYAPVDPFKLIDLLSSTTEMELVELRRRYNETLGGDRPNKKKPEPTSGGQKGNNFEGKNFTKVGGKVEVGGSAHIVGGKRKKESLNIISNNEKKSAPSHILTPSAQNPKSSRVPSAQDQNSEAYWEREQSDLHDPDVFQMDRPVKKANDVAEVSDSNQEKSKGQSTAEATSPQPKSGIGSKAEGVSEEHIAKAEKNFESVKKEQPSESTTVTTDESEASPSELKTHSETNSESASQSNSQSVQDTSASKTHDPDRAKRYSEWTQKMKESGEVPKPIDVQKLRDKQLAQAKEIQEAPSVEENRKHFLKTLFTMDPKDIKKG